MAAGPFVLTGASSGIGAEIARQLVASGRDVIGIGRSADALSGLAERLGRHFQFHVVDLLDDTALVRLVEDVLARHPALSGLIHCAGVLRPATLGSVSSAMLDQTLGVNFRVPFLLTNLLATRLVAARGALVFVNSSAGLQASGGNAAYCASKFALRALADAARVELNACGVRVASIYPGRTATPTMERLYAAENRSYRPELLLQPADVAAAVLSIIDAPEHAEITDIGLRPRQKSY